MDDAKTESVSVTTFMVEITAKKIGEMTNLSILHFGFMKQRNKVLIAHTVLLVACSHQLYIIFKYAEVGGWSKWSSYSNVDMWLLWVVWYVRTH